ncbi:uncharacterized protein At5g08430-like isoform X2 [Euphorbia lathyris]|uniref:uncharacterized protein At5g08430-like isoform X2 n=1 Tax=Euphorbia lathyris TaxID=212925 RepID=UPI003313D35D
MGRRKKKINKEEICEDWCFECKDGGSLRICDYKDCLKAYHPKCVGEDNSFLESEVPWTCSWHFCFNCKRTPKFHCFCCPKAICGICLCDFEFAVIDRRGGFCNNCLMLAGVIEGVKDPYPDQGKVDFDDRETYESIFKDYWELVKQKEGLTSIHVRNAIELVNKDSNSKDFSDLSGGEDSSQVEDEYQPTSTNDRSNDRKGYKAMNKCKRNKGNLSAMKIKVQPKKKEFNGWASNLLSYFLDSIGKDTIEELSQHDVTAIVLQYCNENKLFDPVKKKKVVCDERLQSLLGRKSVQKNSIYNLLTPHFTVNFEQSTDEYEHCSEDEDVSASMSRKRQRRSSSNTKPQNNEAVNVDVHQQGCFASMVAQNIKLVYLNRSSMEKLLQQPETFDAKVIGSYVRIKSDPFDYLQRNIHMLVKVTGIKRTSANDELTKDVLLRVSNVAKDISICQLSNDNFFEEECEDLRQRVKDGRLERPSVMEFKEKARSLHEVITKQWIVKELYRLQKLVDQANEKGWRRELHEYMERKQLLEKSSEQSRLLHEFPEIIADETEVEPNHKHYSKKDEQENSILPESDSMELSKPSAKDSRGDGIVSSLIDAKDFAEHEQENHLEASYPELESGQPIASQSNSGLPEKLKNEERDPTSEMMEISDDEEKDMKIYNLSPEPDSRELPKTSTKDSKEHEHHCQGPKSDDVEQQHHTVSSHESNDGSIRQALINKPVIIQVKENNPEASHPELVLGQPVASQSNSGPPEKLKNKQNEPTVEMIVISDDDEEQDNTVGVTKKTIEISDDEEEHTTIGLSKKTVDDPNSSIWYCLSAHGFKAGPYSISLLKEWMDKFSDELKFKVWKSGQSPEEAMLLTDAIRQFSHGK